MRVFGRRGALCVAVRSCWAPREEERSDGERRSPQGWTASHEATSSDHRCRRPTRPRPPGESRGQRRRRQGKLCQVDASSLFSWFLLFLAADGEGSWRSGLRRRRPRRRSPRRSCGVFEQESEVTEPSPSRSRCRRPKRFQAPGESRRQRRRHSGQALPGWLPLSLFQFVRQTGEA